ncbi:MAG TPA: mandelate racemase/muconate lactonizing enzyme family protein [Planktothrix sp.]|jgi:L-alanine-DL-glutamate epimerase-like enolase superfamily enzyme
MSRTPYIEHIEVRLFSIPVEPPRGDAMQKFSAQELPTVWITDANGLTGMGFGYTIGSGGSTIKHFIEHELSPRLIGKDASNPVELNDFLIKSVHALTPGCIASVGFAAVDVALWDLAAKRAHLPLYKLLGGAKSKVLAYNTHVGWLNRPLDELISKCDEAVRKDGFKALKLKVGKPTAEEDIERVGKVRKKVGPGVQLMVDANQSWTLAEAGQRARTLEPYDIVWLEEPLAATNVEQYAQLKDRTIIPLAGGESIYDIQQFFQYAKQNAFGVMQPDVARIGGITNAMRVCHLAQCAGLDVSPHVSPELSVTVALAVSNSMFIEFIPQTEPILKQPINMADGYALPYDADGHGIEFDQEAMSKFEITDSSPKPASRKQNDKGQAA